jgi:hypothetical protein
MGIDVRFVNGDAPEDFEKLIDENTKVRRAAPDPTPLCELSVCSRYASAHP